MNKFMRIIAISCALLSMNASAEQTAKSDLEGFTQIQFEAAECIAFYRYGYALTKRDNRAYEIAGKFEAYLKFVRKALKLDVGEDAITKIRMKGKESFKAYMEANDHIYETKNDGYDTELLDLYKRYNSQCAGVIRHYQSLALKK